MKKMFVCLLLTIGSVAVFAQNDAAAKKILDEVSAKYKTFKTVQANFTLKIESKAGKKLGTKTGMLYTKAAKYKIVEKNTTIICDGATQWRYEANANEVTISKPETGNATLTPQKIFTNFYDKDFLYKLNGEKVIGGKKLAEIEMTPTDKRKNFFKVYVYVDKATSTITSIKVLETSGNIVTYSMSNMKTNTNLEDNDFVFDKTKYPGVEEIQN
jgi:outer membrane lipoprotein carrier protein